MLPGVVISSIVSKVWAAWRTWSAWLASQESRTEANTKFSRSDEDMMVSKLRMRKDFVLGEKKGRKSLVRELRAL